MFSRLDYYGRNISFGIDNRATFQTYLGSILTLLTIGLIILCILVFGSDLYYSENPNLLDQTSQPLETTPLYFEPDNYTLAFSFGDGYFSFDPSKYFSTAITYEYINNFESYTNVTPLSFRLCSAKDFQRYLGYYQQGNFYCLNINSFILNGSWTENFLSRIYVKVNRCKNTTSNNNSCYSDDIISKKIQDGVYFNIYVEDRSVDGENYKEPFSNYLKDLYWSLDNYIGKHVEVYLRKVSMNTDSGLLLSSYENNFIHKFENYDLDMVSVQNPINRTYPLVKLVIYASAKTQIIKRIYPKIQQVAAEVSGMIKIASTFFVIILGFYTNYALTIYLINSEFDTNTKKKTKKITLLSLKNIELRPNLEKTDVVLTTVNNPLITALEGEEDKQEGKEQIDSRRLHSENEYSHSIDEKHGNEALVSARPTDKMISVKIDSTIKAIQELPEKENPPLKLIQESVHQEKNEQMKKENLNPKEKKNEFINESSPQEQSIDEESLKNQPVHLKPLKQEEFNLELGSIKVNETYDKIEQEGLKSSIFSRKRVPTKIPPYQLRAEPLSNRELKTKKIVKKTTINEGKMEESRSVIIKEESKKHVTMKNLHNSEQFLEKSLLRKSTMKKKLQLLSPRKSSVSANKANESNFKFTFGDYIRSKWCFGNRKQRSKKIKLFQKAEMIINSFFDARLLIRKIIDIARMKKFLFTDEQLKVYEFLTKPKLFYEKDDISRKLTIDDMAPVFTYISEKKVENNMATIENFYKRLQILDGNANHVDKALFDMLDEDLKEHFMEDEGLGMESSAK